MQKLNQNHVGTALGSTFALAGAVWAIIVAIGSAGAFLRFAMALHFISGPYVIAPFSLGIAVMLVIVAFLAGYILGWVFSAIYNSIKK